MEQLGYPTTIESMKARMNHIEASPEYHTLLASYDGEVIGMIRLLL
ncbi:hypothetical protein [Bacillus sp. SD088]|nr:hypothetical protein [Bacillus sp. SD088]